MHRHTCATLIRGGVNVVGIVQCERSGPAATLRFLKGRASRYGVLKTGGQILGRIADRAVNAGLDRALLATLIDGPADQVTIVRSGVPVLRTDSYSTPTTLSAIAGFDPDLFVVHTKFIVGRKVRALARVAVIGGHPGITPWFRGAYSAFWALARGKPELVGWTVFLIDDGIDTGPIIAQGVLTAAGRVDSHNTLGWRGMTEQARVQTETIRALDRGETIALRPIAEVPEDSYFGPPTLLEFLRYRRTQLVAR